jgi:hypothetical protein
MKLANRRAFLKMSEKCLSMMMAHYHSGRVLCFAEIIKP